MDLATGALDTHHIYIGRATRLEPAIYILMFSQCHNIAREIPGSFYSFSYRHGSNGGVLNSKYSCYYSRI
jgi:hypothetical protein